MAITPLSERTRLSQDPLRNFKFRVTLFHTNNNIQTRFAELGFTSVEGLTMSTEMIPYREGGWNTNLHKMPGMTDFSPVTLASGVFSTKPGMWDLARQMFSVQWGQGSLPANTDYRFDALIRVYDHPVTTGPGASVGTDTSGAVLGFYLYNGWVANIAFSGLNAIDNSILVQQMTIHHEGMDVYWGRDDTETLTHSNTI